MRKRILMTLLGVFFAFSAALAEERTFTGTVVTSNGEPVMGATVTVTGTTVSTITDMDGSFSLVVPDGCESVTVTYSGMKKQVVPVMSTPVILYSLKEGAAKSYKKNAFNLELSVGSPAGDLADIVDGRKDSYLLEIGFGYKYNLSQYVGWHVIDASFAIMPGKYHFLNTTSNVVDEPYHSGVMSATTGVIVRTPAWKNLSLFASANVGFGYDGLKLGAVYKARAGVNLTKWMYLAYKFERLNRKVHYDENHTGYFDAKLDSHSIALGFNF